MGSAPSLLSIVSETSARPSGGRPAVPANTTSSILPPRSGLTPCSPMTQENASTTLDLPDPLGPTTQVIPRSNRSVVAEANDLNPRRVSAFRYTWQLSSSSGRPVRASVRAAAPAVFPFARQRCRSCPPRRGSARTLPRAAVAPVDSSGRLPRTGHLMYHSAAKTQHGWPATPTQGGLARRGGPRRPKRPCFTISARITDIAQVMGVDHGISGQGSQRGTPGTGVPLYLRPAGARQVGGGSRAG